jgi:hypothetical protein
MILSRLKNLAAKNDRGQIPEHKRVVLTDSGLLLVLAGILRPS